MTIDGKEFYKILQKDHASCAAAQKAELKKFQQGSHLARLRATELNTYLAIFQSARDCLMAVDLDTYSQEDLAEIKEGIDNTRKRFQDLLSDPQYTGRTGEIDAEWAKKKKEKSK